MYLLLVGWRLFIVISSHGFFGLNVASLLPQSLVNSCADEPTLTHAIDRMCERVMIIAIAMAPKVNFSHARRHPWAAAHMCLSHATKDERKRLLGKGALTHIQTPTYAGAVGLGLAWLGGESARNHTFNESIRMVSSSSLARARARTKLSVAVVGAAAAAAAATNKSNWKLCILGQLKWALCIRLLLRAMHSNSVRRAGRAVLMMCLLASYSKCSPRRCGCVICDH